MLRMEKMYSDLYWQPSNITEFFFSDETGCNNVTQEKVMILYQEFTSIMRSIYQNGAKKYEDILAIIIREQDLGGIDFPLIAPSLDIEPFSKLLPPELAKKLDLDKEEEEEKQSTNDSS